MTQMGKNNLPLMGGGDWNDGMNKVGIGGKGTSVWLGFFQYWIIEKFIELAKNGNKELDVNNFEKTLEKLKKALNTVAWEKDYYLRAFFDDGTKLGSQESEECKIDLLSQSFSIITGVAPRENISKILDSVETNLVDKELGIVKLLTPAFQKTKHIPGYIMDYPEGVRENGGQYTHSVAWYIMALIRAGYIDRAYNYYQMINPINRTKDKKDTDVYKVEPYVIAADIYSNKNNPARGGWTWYTGSAGWFYNVGLTEILGFTKEDNKIKFKPHLPSGWKSFELEYHYLDTTYKIKVNITATKEDISLDGEKINKDYVTIKNDKRVHAVVINIKG
jgi:cyclic beta-1,2-glucan synthetase